MRASSASAVTKYTTGERKPLHQATDKATIRQDMLMRSTNMTKTQRHIGYSYAIVADEPYQVQRRLTRQNLRLPWMPNVVAHMLRTLVQTLVRQQLVSYSITQTTTYCVDAS